MKGLAFSPSHRRAEPWRGSTVNDDRQDTSDCYNDSALEAKALTGPQAMQKAHSLRLVTNQDSSSQHKRPLRVSSIATASRLMFRTRALTCICGLDELNDEYPYLQQSKVQPLLISSLMDTVVAFAGVEEARGIEVNAFVPV